MGGCRHHAELDKQMIVRAQVGYADQAEMRLVHRAESDHIRQVADAPRQVGVSIDVVFLQVVLNIEPVAHHVGRVGLPAEEKRKHGEGGEAIIVVRPHQLREVIRLLLMQQRGAGFMEAVDIQSSRLKGPGGRAIAAREATPDILMRVNEEVDVVRLRLLQHGFQIIEIVLVVHAGTVVLDRFPSDDEAQEIQPPMLEAQEMLIGFFQRERTPDE